MNTKTNMLRSKIIGATTLCAMGALAILPMNAADARLVFSTEFESSTEDSNGDGNYTLSFGSALAGEIYYDESEDAFVINKSTTTQGDSTVTGNTQVDGNSVVTGTSTLTGNATLGADLSVAGNSQLTGDLNVDGATTLDETTVDGTLNATGATDLDSTLNVDGSATLNDGLSVTAGTTALKNTTVDGTLGATGNATLGADLSVTGNSQLTGDLNVDGATTLDETTVDGTLNATGATDLDSTLNVDGAATLNDNLTVVGTSNLQGATDIDSTLNVDGATTLKSTLSVDGDITLNNDSQIIGLRAENKALASAPACTDATDLGRIFYDTTNNTLLYCYQNGGTFGWSSTSGDEVNASATYYAEFANFSVLADGTNNVGTMIAEYDDTEDRSFYQWSTRQASANDYDVVLQWQVPSDFQSFQANSLQIDHKQGGTNAALAIDIEDDSNAAIGSTIAPANTATWATENVDLTAATVAAGETLTFKFKMTAQTTEESFLSNVQINYVKK